MSQRDPFDRESQAMRHELVTSLQILTLTAELLAIDLRDEHRSTEQVRDRARGLRSALQRVLNAARGLSDVLGSPDASDSTSTADNAPLGKLRAFVGLIIHFIGQDDVERDVLAEYVDELHHLATGLIATIDEPPPR